MLTSYHLQTPSYFGFIFDIHALEVNIFPLFFSLILFYPPLVLGAVCNLADREESLSIPKASCKIV